MLKGFTDKMDAYLGQQKGFNAGMSAMLPGAPSAKQAIDNMQMLDEWDRWLHFTSGLGSRNYILGWA